MAMGGPTRTAPMDAAPADDADYDFSDERMAQAMAGERAPSAPGAAGPADGPSAPPAPPPPPKAQPDVSSDPSGPARKKIAKPLLIYTAQLHMAVFEAAESIDKVHQLAENLGGYLVRRTDRMIVVRVPSEKFYPALKSVAKLGDVLHREESVQDVTDQFYDLRTRLRNAHATRDRLEKLLAQAKNVKEVLMVEQQLQRVTENIERMEGKLKRMRELIAFSTLTVQFKPRATETIKPGVKLPFSWLNQLGLQQLLNL
jgi:hypothetical protein